MGRAKKRGRAAGAEGEGEEAAPHQGGWDARPSDLAERVLPVLAFGAAGTVALALGTHLRVFDPRCACNFLLCANKEHIWNSNKYKFICVFLIACK